MKSSIQIGKVYKIEELLELLSPDMQLGHIVIAGTHKYHQDKTSLEDTILDATKGLGKGEKLPTIYVTVLNIVDPFERYARFKPFYNSIERDVLFAIDQSAHKEIAFSMEGMIGEAKNFGHVGTEELSDLLVGLNIYFNRKGIGVGMISDKKYITFSKMRAGM